MNVDQQVAVGLGLGFGLLFALWAIELWFEGKQSEFERRLFELEMARLRRLETEAWVRYFQAKQREAAAEQSVEE